MEISLYIYYKTGDKDGNPDHAGVKDAMAYVSGDARKVDGELKYCYMIGMDVNGLVTGVSAGKATITATSNADGTLNASCEVTVTEVPKFTVSGVSSAAPGSTVSITIRIDQPGVTADLPDAGILGAILEVGYPEGFILKSIERGDALGSMSFLEPEKADDKYPNPGGFLWDAMAPDTSDGILVTLTFDIPADAAEGTYDRDFFLYGI